MFEAIKDALIHTPWWVYVLFIYFIIVGLRATQTRVVALKNMIILPFVFLVLSIETLQSAVNLVPFNIIVWMAAILVGMFLGTWQVLRMPLTVDKKNWLIKVPGTWTTLLLILIIFASKYYFNYQLAIDPAKKTDTTYEIAMLVISGFCTGLFLGRFFCFVHRVRSGSHVSLNSKD